MIPIALSRCLRMDRGHTKHRALSGSNGRLAATRNNTSAQRYKATHQRAAHLAHGFSHGYIDLSQSAVVQAGVDREAHEFNDTE